MAQAFLSENQIKYHNRLQTDYRFFAKAALLIRTKAGEMLPLVFNDAQDYLHKKLEFQLQATGKVRALILKGRQQGCSTYVGGRFYWKTTRLSGKATFILSHEADTTEKLFQMVERYHANCPDPVKAETDVANRRRMVFSGLNSEYFVGTAGNENVGRGGTVQYLHASEAAFYPDGDAFSKGLLQSVPDMAGTEVIIESTANGMDPLFYAMCMKALDGKSEYQLIFIPWFWQSEYRKTPEADFVPTPEEVKIAQLYKLDWAQVRWRRMKIETLKELGFKQEYPCNIEEAFAVSGNALIDSAAIMAARKSGITDVVAGLVLGVDPAPRGTTGFALRRGRECIKTWKVSTVGDREGEMRICGIVADMLNSLPIIKAFIDLGNGFGVHDRLIELGYKDQVLGVNFAEGAIEDTRFLNKRAEIWHLLKDWLENGGVSIPDDDELHKQLTCVPAAKKTSSGLTKLEAKEKIIEDTKIDPHQGDALALTFSYPVRAAGLNGLRSSGGSRKGKSPLKTTMRRERIGGPTVATEGASTTLKWQ